MIARQGKTKKPIHKVKVVMNLFQGTLFTANETLMECGNEHMVVRSMDVSAMAEDMRARAPLHELNYPLSLAVQSLQRWENAWSKPQQAIARMCERLGLGTGWNAPPGHLADRTLAAVNLSLHRIEVLSGKVRTSDDEISLLEQQQQQAEKRHKRTVAYWKGMVTRERRKKSCPAVDRTRKVAKKK